MKTNNISTKVYTSESVLRDPSAFFKGISNDLFNSRELAWRLFVRDISAQYRQSLLGFFWVIVPPVIMALGLSYAASASIINVGETPLPYPAYVMLSMSLWQVFSESLLAPITGVTANKQLLLKINFPIDAILISKMGEVIFSFLMKLILIVFIFVWYEISLNTLMVFFSIFALFGLMMLGFFIGLFLVPFGMLYQDVSRLLVSVLGFWMILTPVIYPVPDKESVFQSIVLLNPVTPMLVTVRDLATGNQPLLLNEFFIVSIITTIGLIISWILFRITIPIVNERLGS